MGATPPGFDGPTRPRRGPIAVLWGSFVLVGLVLVGVLWRAGLPTWPGLAARDRSEVPWPRSPWKNARPDVAYVGDAACARCHAEIAETFRRHPMGRSLAPVGASSTVEGDRLDRPATFDAAGSRFTVERRGDRMIHREARFGADGRELAAVEAVVRYAVGSGRRGVTYLVERGGRLFESPISWYSHDRRWSVSPDYDRNGVHFDRPIEPVCLFCHANRVEPVAGAVNRYEEPTFRGHAIGCERCHGPGGLHIRRPEMVDGRDPTIVNPAHLGPALRLAVCEQCHLVGDQRIERPGRAMFDYRPGLPTSAFVAIFGRRDAAKHKAVGHVEQMKASRCFREGRGRLDCTSCHDPHQLPDPGEAAGYYRRRCLTCHEPSACKLPEPDRLARSRDDDCVRCHMPKAPSADVGHVATTDHRILRAPGESPAGPGPPDDGLPMVLLNGDGLEPAEVAALDRERAIAIAAEAPRLPASPGLARVGAYVLGRLDRALEERPADRAARRMKALILAIQGRRAEAIRQVRMVLQAAPSDEKAMDECLAYAVQDRDIDTILEVARRAVAIDPASPTFHERLAFGSVQRRDWDTAIRESRAALAIDPFLRFPRMFLVQSLLHRGDHPGAVEEFATLNGLNPGLREPLALWFAEERRSAAP